MIKWIGNTWIVQEFIGFLFFLYVWLVILTSRVRVDPYPTELIEKKISFFMSFWHGRFIGAPFSYLKQNSKFKPYVLISKHRDGRAIASAMRWFKTKTIDGSRAKKDSHSLKRKQGGVGAAVAIVHLMKNENVLMAMTPDSRKPGYTMTKGLISLASETGNPIVLMSFSAKRGAFLKTWDKFLFPYPFNSIVVKHSTPIYIPLHLTPEQQEEWRKKLEKELLDLTTECDKAVNLEKSPFYQRTE
ncbi:MAG: DUF374 domain-containing protein [Alphaproteobacteria bacterium]|nr:DUF374 domain-containing protein [Alphaproteobacteria bacterium]